VSRLDYAPKLKDIEITDVNTGLGGFTPKPHRPVSFAALKDALKKAGNALDSAGILVSRMLKREGDKWWLIPVSPTTTKHTDPSRSGSVSLTGGAAATRPPPSRRTGDSAPAHHRQDSRMSGERLRLPRR
jgi:hypothetical protein